MTRARPESGKGSYRIQSFFNDVWYGRSFWSDIFLPLSWLFGLGVSIRRAAYRYRIFSSIRLPVPVIVIGNLSVGGTGKTPLVAWLAMELAGQGRRPGIVSRGYGRTRSGSPRLVEPDARADEVGDEPLELRRNTGVPVCVCADRVAAGRMLVAAGVDVIIADDGLQHYRLARDLEVAVLDGARLHGNGRLLPAGPLRESEARLANVDLTIVNGIAEYPEALHFRLVPDVVQALSDGRRVDLSHFSGQRVWSVAGMANPARFTDMLREAGIIAVGAPVPDHGVIQLKELREQKKWPVLMTEKDAVKYSAATVEDAWSVSVRLEMDRESYAALTSKLDGVLQ